MTKIFKGPDFIKYFIPILEVLQETGGSGTVAEVIDLVIEKMGISEEEQADQLKSGGSRVRIAFNGQDCTWSNQASWNPQEEEFGV